MSDKPNWEVVNGTAAAAANDIFDSSLNIEQTHFNEGYDLGFQDGLVLGKSEAKEVGLKQGFEVGEELGFYKGCVGIWNSAIRIDPTLFSNRVQKGVKLIEDLLEKYPISEPENEEATEALEDLRLKFKMVCSRLGVKMEYSGYPKGSDEVKGIGF